MTTAETDVELIDDVQTDDEQAQPGKNFAKTVREWALVVIIAVTAAVLMKAYVVQQFYVSGQSMDSRCTTTIGSWSTNSPTTCTIHAGVTSWYSKKRRG